jgi:hypothetical protein
MDPEKRRSYKTSLFDYWRSKKGRVAARFFSSRSQGIASRSFLDRAVELIDMKVPVFMLFAENDRSYRDFMEARRGSLDHLLARAGDRLQVRTVEGSGLQEVEGQIRILDIIASDLGRLASAGHIG